MHRSGSIITLQPLLKHKIDITSLTVSTSEEQAIIIQDFIHTILDEDFGQINLYQDTIDVIIYEAG